MVTLIAQISSALALGLAALLLHGWLLAHGAQPPLALDYWLTALPALAVRMLLPSTSGGVALALLVLSLQHFALVRLLAAVLSRPGPRPAPETALR